MSSRPTEWENKTFIFFHLWIIIAGFSKNHHRQVFSRRFSSCSYRLLLHSGDQWLASTLFAIQSSSRENAGPEWTHLCSMHPQSISTIASTLLSILLFIYLAVLGIKQGLVTALQASTIKYVTPGTQLWNPLLLWSFTWKWESTPLLSFSTKSCHHVQDALKYFGRGSDVTLGPLPSNCSL